MRMRDAFFAVSCYIAYLVISRIFQGVFREYCELSLATVVFLYALYRLAFKTEYMNCVMNTINSKALKATFGGATTVSGVVATALGSECWKISITILVLPCAVVFSYYLHRHWSSLVISNLPMNAGHEQAEEYAELGLKIKQLKNSKKHLENDHARLLGAKVTLEKTVCELEEKADIERNRLHVVVTSNGKGAVMQLIQSANGTTILQITTGAAAREFTFKFCDSDKKGFADGVEDAVNKTVQKCKELPHWKSYSADVESGVRRMADLAKGEKRPLQKSEKKFSGGRAGDHKSVLL